MFFIGIELSNSDSVWAYMDWTWLNHREQCNGGFTSKSYDVMVYSCVFWRHNGDIPFWDLLHGWMGYFWDLSSKNVAPMRIFSGMFCVNICELPPVSSNMTGWDIPFLNDCMNGKSIELKGECSWIFQQTMFRYDTVCKKTTYYIYTYQTGVK